MDPRTFLELRVLNALNSAHPYEGLFVQDMAMVFDVSEKELARLLSAAAQYPKPMLVEQVTGSSDRWYILWPGRARLTELVEQFAEEVERLKAGQQAADVKAGSLEHQMLQGLSNMVLPTTARIREWVERQTGIRNPDTTWAGLINLAVKGCLVQVFPPESTELHFKLTELGESTLRSLKGQSSVRT